MTALTLCVSAAQEDGSVRLLGLDVDEGGERDGRISCTYGSDSPGGGSPIFDDPS